MVSAHFCSTCLFFRHRFSHLFRLVHRGHVSEPLVCLLTQKDADNREIEVEEVIVQWCVEPLYPTRADKLFSQHLDLLTLDALRAACIFRSHAHPLQVLVKAEMVTLLNNFFEFADIASKKS